MHVDFSGGILLAIAVAFACVLLGSVLLGQKGLLAHLGGGFLLLVGMFGFYLIIASHTTQAVPGWIGPLIAALILIAVSLRLFRSKKIPGVVLGLAGLVVGGAALLNLLNISLATPAAHDFLAFAGEAVNQLKAMVQSAHQNIG